MLKLIHGADFHLDSPFAGLTPEQAARRRREQRLLLDQLARLAVDRQADLVLLAGDLFDTGEIYRETALALVQALGRIPCPVCIAPGNHDFCSPSSPYTTLDWPDNVHIFSTDTIEAVDFPALSCTVWGRAFTGPHLSQPPLAGFQVPSGQGDHLHLMVLHGAVGPDSDYGPISTGDMAASGLAYLALGHVHQCSGLQLAGRTHWAYPGCPAGRGFDETGEKGVLYVELSPDGAQAQLMPMGQHQYQVLSVDVTGQEPLAAIEKALPPNTRDHIYRILLTGQGEAPDLAALHRALEGRFYGLTLRDHTRLPQQLWARREEDGLTGLFLRLMYDRCSQSPQDPICQQAARFGLAALEKGEDPYL